MRTSAASQHQDLDHTAEIRRRFPCDSIVGRSEALARVLDEAASMAPMDIGLLITGPTGTGKSALARAVHDNSRRRAGPFVAINCATISTALLEAELFGAERGSHSMAFRRTTGKVGAAQDGTLFLDEIGDLAPESQTKLLQLLEERAYYPVGASDAIAANIRVIAATNVDLAERVQRGTFRRDLLFRLNVVTIEMPALAARRDDIPALATHFARAKCAQHELPLVEVPHALAMVLQEATWPGQIRELANAIEAGVVRASVEGARALAVHHVFPSRERTAAERPDYREATRRFQRRYLLDVLGECDWNINVATKVLKIARAHLYSRIESFGLKRPELSR